MPVPFRILSLAIVLSLAACSGGDAPPPAEEAPEAPAPTPETSSALLNPNRATESELAAVTGLTPELVSALVAARPFDDMLQVDALLAESLGEGAREEVYRAMFLPIDLNNASEEEILLIPGVGDRMAHEFDEDRPYEAIERFRREIGKYVDEEEVARLERNVEIR